MDAALWWFGLIHLAAYASAGFSGATILFINWTAKNWKLKTDMIRVYARMLNERHEAKKKREAE